MAVQRRFAAGAAKSVLDRKITVRFNADTNSELPWTFSAVQNCGIGKNRRTCPGLLRSEIAGNSMMSPVPRRLMSFPIRRESILTKSIASALPNKRLKQARALICRFSFILIRLSPMIGGLMMLKPSPCHTRFLNRQSLRVRHPNDLPGPRRHRNRLNPALR